MIPILWTYSLFNYGIKLVEKVYLLLRFVCNVIECLNPDIIEVINDKVHIFVTPLLIKFIFYLGKLKARLWILNTLSGNYRIMFFYVRHFSDDLISMIN